MATSAPTRRPELPPRVRDALTRYAAALRERFGARLLSVRLFGSYARGEAHEHSDVDVFVLLDEVPWADRVAALELAGDVWYETDLLVSPVIMPRAQYEHWREQERRLVLEVEREGIPA